ncbi:B3 domain-containing protein Os11g0197600-like isoform X3 [Salvia splendens]|uniref:B3 domain-containing protein Os11g0197600-like isoform X3 n=1 Tax=Salvia splendens TaxID=180675 RepID=UPI001C25DBB6|nr:B3 domain-containing protein Os11g0197600-like isoform X3 [Salvia splendens]
MEGKNPSFYKILMELSSHLRLPQGFMQKYGKMLPKQVELRVCNNTWNTWKVGMKKQTLDGEDHYFFEKGWTKFCEDARLEIFELLIFSYIDKSTFLVTVYGVTALEKTIFSPPRCIIVLKDYRCYKHIPKKFAEACRLFDKKEISLEYVGGYTSPVSLTMWQGRIAFGAGWSAFLKANRLSSDIALSGSRKTLCFEFVPMKNLMKVQPLHN